MRNFRALFLRIIGLFNRERRDRELDDELESNLQMQIDDNLQRGMSPDEARYAALRKFGNVTLVKEETRELWSLTWLEQLWQDLRFGLRMLAKNPGFTAVAVLTVALGIGANTAMFTVVNTILLQPLPYPDSNHLVYILRQNGGDSIPMFNYWVQNNPGFENLAAFSDPLSLGLTVGTSRQLVQALNVSSNYFRLFEARPILGRTFSSEDERPGGPQVLMMSFGLWQRQFGADPSILHKTVDVGGVPFTVVGILSSNFKSYPAAEVWIPLQPDPDSRAQAHVYWVAARIPPRMTLAEANSRMAVIGKRYAQAHPEQLGNDDKLDVTLMQEQITENFRPALLIFLGAVGLVLLIAWVNLANLLLGRATARRREIAVRAALGARRGRIVRQLVTESLLLAVIGGALGLAVASWGVRVLLALAPGDLPRVQEMAGIPAFDPWVAGFAVILSLITGIAFGIFPALQFSQPQPDSYLKEAGGSSSGGVKHNRTRNTLITAEIALAVVLLCGAILLIRSFVALLDVDPGFDPHHVITVGISVDDPKYTSASAVDMLSRQVVERLESIPDVQSAALANSLPSTSPSDMIFNIPGRPPQEGYKFLGDVLWQIVSPHYFDALRIPLRSGRLFGELEPPHTLIISEAMAHKFWPNQNPVGQIILLGSGLGPQFDAGATEIVGVVGNVRYGLGGGSPPAMYQTFSQVHGEKIQLMNGLGPEGVIIRTKRRADSSGLIKSIKQVLQTGDMPLLTTNVQTLEEVMRDSRPEANFHVILLGTFAAIALLLATVGIYGVTSYLVTCRTHEIGVRVALGAKRLDVIRLVLGRGLMLTLIGIIVGLAGAFALTRLLSNMLYAVRPTDPFTFVAVSLIMSAVSVFACYIPARRATKVDPLVALRHE